MADVARFGGIAEPPLRVDFLFSDLPGPISIGFVKAGHLVDRTIIDIQSPFDGATQITVGDSVAQARLQAVGDNWPGRTNFYEVNNSYEYATMTEVFVFFPAGTPTTGSGRAIIYLD